MSGAATEDMTGGVDTDAAVASLRAALQSPVDSDNDNDAAQQPPPQPPTSSNSPPTDALAQVMHLTMEQPGASGTSLASWSPHFSLPRLNLN